MMYKIVGIGVYVVILAVGFIWLATILNISPGYTTLAIIVAIASCFSILLSLYFAVKRHLILEEKCDPVTFLKQTENHLSKWKTRPKNKFSTILTCNQAVGYMLLGEFQKAKEIYLSVEQGYIASNKVIFLTYQINLMTCLYQLGEIDAAEEIYKNQFQLIRPDEKLKVQIKMFHAERFLYLEKYAASKNLFEELLTKKRKKLFYVRILYALARIEHKTGNVESAKEKYKEVIEQGNKLWIVTQAQNYLVELGK